MGCLGKGCLLIIVFLLLLVIAFVIGFYVGTKPREIPQAQTSEDEQNAAAGALIDYLAHMRDLQLSDEQLAEVRRRRASGNRATVPLSEVRERLRRLGE